MPIAAPFAEEMASLETLEAPAMMSVAADGMECRVAVSTRRAIRNALTLRNGGGHIRPDVHFHRLYRALVALGEDPSDYPDPKGIRRASYTALPESDIKYYANVRKWWLWREYIYPSYYNRQQCLTTVPEWVSATWSASGATLTLRINTKAMPNWQGKTHIELTPITYRGSGQGATICYERYKRVPGDPDSPCSHNHGKLDAGQDALLTMHFANAYVLASRINRNYKPGQVRASCQGTCLQGQFYRNLPAGDRRQALTGS